MQSNHNDSPPPLPPRPSLVSQETSNDFAVNKDKLEAFSHLLDAIDEFNKTQRDFHNDMQVIYANATIINDSNTADKYLLIALLEPYSKLRNNPFPDVSGKSVKKTYLSRTAPISIEKEIQAITSVIQPQSEDFKKILSALFDCSSNQTETNALFAKILADHVLPAHYKTLLDYLNVRGFFDKPFQQLMRYEMQLLAIKNYLIKSGYSEVEHQTLFSSLNTSIGFLHSEVEKINQYRDFMSDLKRTERLLAMCLDREINNNYDLVCKVNRDSYHSSNDEAFKFRKTQIENLIVYITTIIMQVKSSLHHVNETKAMILNGVSLDAGYLHTINKYMAELLTDLLAHYSVVLDAKNDFEKSYASSLTSGINDYVITPTYRLLQNAKYFLWSAEVKEEKFDPLEELKKMKQHFVNQYASVQTIIDMENRQRPA